MYLSGMIDLPMWTVAAGLAIWLTFPTPALLPAGRETFTTRTGAYLDPVFTGPLDATAGRALRTAGALCVLLVAGYLVVQQVTDLAPALVVMPPLGLLLAGLSTVRLRMAGREFVVPDGRSAVARPRRVVVADYVPWLVPALTWCGVVIALASAVLALRGRHEVDTTAVVLAADTAVLVVLVLFFEWYGRALCERPTPAVDASHLYLQDAWRADALISAYCVVCINAMLLTMGITASATGSSATETLLGFAAPLTVVAVIAVPRAHHFRQRLWGTLRPGQLLLPGQPVPPAVGATS